ncbi:glycoside hydrolase family 27 protein [Streptomyces sp. Ncost-T10-10d]|uniref:glycoside hydrolase family 27 protein n=1 Tax=Streptomyces sp. Ncost-T10-10d TaxID=1839774 RepID=UPI00081F3FCA|nr:glycoside hydrolase family 27 protein [Streptomyces sp. Ncost-T10-10d]SCF81503.1 Alpha galactosidase A [Streptomyces sp. Ncost-T10-10d]
MRRTTRHAAFIAAATLPLALGLSSGTAQAKTPYIKPFMGWSSWSVESSSRDGYGTRWLNEGNIKNAADALSGKLASAGYKYLNIDAGWNFDYDWNFHTDANGIPDADKERFPSGMASVSDYVHGKGLKLGLYGAAGLEKEVYDKDAPILGTDCTAQDIAAKPLTPTNKWGGNWKIDYSNPCAQAYFDSIVARYAAWGVDFIKIDGVTKDNVEDIKAWSTAIDHSGRKMWLSASAWPVDIEAADGLKPHANGVRIDTDIECYCETTSTWTSSVDDRFSDLPKWLNKVQAPHYFADLDAMPINNNSGSGLQDGIDDVERQTVMTFWSMASSPLYVGGDIYFLDDKAKAILTNPEVIAVDQAAVLPRQVRSGDTQVWTKRVGDDTYLAVYNLGSEAADISVTFKELGLRGPQKLRDVAARKDLGTAKRSWTASSVAAHGSRLIKLS